MPGRQYTGATGYRYGFNGQEKDDEISGAGNSNTAEFWQYDTRLGRRWNTDPVDKPWMSPYHAFSNKPILNIDPNGANDDKYYFDKDKKMVGYEADDAADQYYFEDDKGNVTYEDKKYSENKSPGFSIVKVYVDPTGIGHTAIGMDGTTVGFYPHDRNIGGMWDSKMEYETYSSTEFEKHYKHANIFFLTVSDVEKKTIKTALDGMMKQVDAKTAVNYHLTWNNCTTRACDAINKGNLQFKNYIEFDGTFSNYGKLDFTTPISLNGFLKDQYNNKDGGSPLKSWLDRGAMVDKGSVLDKMFGLSKPNFHN